MWLLLTVVLLIGLVVWYLFQRTSSGKSGAHSGYDFFVHTINHRRSQKKEAGMTQIIEYAHKNGSVSNNEVEDLLGVSDATASRYLSELEKQKQLQQHSDGPNTHYTPIASINE